MADDQRRNTGAFDKAPGSAARQAPQGAPNRSPTMPGGVPTALRSARAQVVVPVRCKFDSIIDFVETQSVNISRTGMFLTTPEVVPVGTMLELEVGLADGLSLLKGKAEVVRVSTSPPTGLGVRFVQLEAASQSLVDRIVDVNTQENKRPTVPLDFATSDVGRGAAAAAAHRRRGDLEGLGGRDRAGHGHGQLLRLQPPAEHSPGWLRGSGRKGSLAGHCLRRDHHHRRRCGAVRRARARSWPSTKNASASV